jgi:hypothetical protein
MESLNRNSGTIALVGLAIAIYAVYELSKIVIPATSGATVTAK